MRPVRFLLSALVALALIGGGALIVLMPPGAAFHTALANVVLQSRQFQGAAYLAAGDRYVSVEFPDAIFPSPPVITLTAASQGGPSYSVGNVSRHGFRVELGTRATRDRVYFWQAAWDRYVEKEYVEQIQGKEAVFRFEFGGRGHDALHTGYAAYRPSEIAVPDLALQDIEGEISGFREVVLEAAHRDYMDRNRCNPADRLRVRLRLRFLECPPKAIAESVPVWDGPDPEAWRVVPAPRGLRLHRERQTAASKERAAASLATLLRPARMVDVSRHNNQLVDFVAHAEASGAQPEDGWTLVRFDSHSDIYAYDDPNRYRPSGQIGDFLNRLVGDGRIREIFWVLPDWSRHSAVEEVFWSEEFPFDAGVPPGPYLEGPSTMELFVDPASGDVHFRRPPAHRDPAEFRRVQLHKLVLEELPDFGNEKRRLLLEFDADFFSNTGHDTMMAAAWNPSRELLLQRLETVAAAVIEKNIHPELAYLCLSPHYVGPEDRGTLLETFATAMESNGQKDVLMAYAHVDTFGPSAAARSLARSSGLHGFFWELRRLDARNWPADQRIEIAADDAEYVTALELLERTRLPGVHRPTSLMYRLDRFDGEADGTIRLSDLQRVAGLEDPAWVTTGQPGRAAPGS